jgi:hypothetical protein
MTTPYLNLQVDMASNDASTSSPPSPSSITSVVTISDPTKWMKFSKGHLLAELHATYWGKKDTEDHQQLSDYELSEDDDIINGCHVLNINNQAIKMGNNIWVRVSVLNQNG